MQPEKIGPYEIKSELGRGGMATVRPDEMAAAAIQELLKARYGWEVGEDILQVLGRATLEAEFPKQRHAGTLIPAPFMQLPTRDARQRCPVFNNFFF